MKDTLIKYVNYVLEICHIPPTDSQTCYKGYSMDDEEVSEHCVGWDSEPCTVQQRAQYFTAPGWKFTSAWDIWGLAIPGVYTEYGGGGYIAELDVNKDFSDRSLNELYENLWIDRQTRVVSLEYTYYCVNLNLFTYNVFMAEFPETGGVFSYYLVYPMRVLQHVGPLGMYIMFCEIVYLIFLLCYTIMIFYRLYKQRRQYFKKGWQAVDFCTMCMSFAAIIMYVGRYLMVNETFKKYRADPERFVNFHHLAIFDQSFNLIIGVVVFLSTCRVLGTLGYNARMNSIYVIFTRVSTDLMSFGSFFLYIFVGYALFGYLLFGSTLISYKNIYSTMGTLFISMIGKSRFTDINTADPVMAQIYFFSFVFFLVFVLLTFFLSILCESISNVREDNTKVRGDELVEYVMKKVQSILPSARNDNVQPVKSTYLFSIVVKPS
jgi:hypothetical protein